MEQVRGTKLQQEQRILQALDSFPTGASVKELLEASKLSISERTLQRRLSILVKSGKVRMEGQTNQVRYFLAVQPAELTIVSSSHEVSLSADAKAVLALVRRPASERKPVGYNRHFLDAYQPNQTSYLSEKEKEQLSDLGKTNTSGAEAGTYAREVLERLLIDLSWNSSRLEGNTYSLLDTQLLIVNGRAPGNASPRETQMILNHKDAIEFIVENRDGDIGINRFTITSLHAMLSNNLLGDPAASGRLRTFAVLIGQSVYTPLSIHQQIEEIFGLLLQKASMINNPFEQAFFIMLHLPYLQPFDDVNKRVSRIAANIPLNRHNLSPLTFTEVPQALYTAGLLGVYELNTITLLKEVFIWAYERSAARYASIRQSLGEPNPFRLQYRQQLRELVRVILNDALTREQASTAIKTFSVDIPEKDRTKFIETIDEEILSLHEGNFARYGVRPSQFEKWKEGWK